MSRGARLARPPAAVVFALAWAVCAFYGAIHLDHRWIPHDEGTLAHAAQRVATGELPHADFDDVYTGGLDFVNAAGFELFGESLVTMRIVLYAVFLAWLAALLGIANRFMSPLAAAGATVAAVAWGLPNYAAPLPSWYNLFFATFAVLALLRAAETNRRRWLWIAGVCAGVSIAIKITGFYFVAAALLYFVHRAARPADESDAASTDERDRARAAPASSAGRAYSIFVTVSLLLFLLAVGALVDATNAAAFVDFVLPIALLVGVVLVREWQAPRGRSGARLGTLLRTVAPFLGGVAVPLALLLIPYVRAGSLDAFVNGVFLLPARRMEFAVRAPPGLLRPLGFAVVALAIGFAYGGARLGRIRAVAGGALALALLLGGASAAVYRGVFTSLMEVVPLALAIATIPLWRRERADESPPRANEASPRADEAPPRAGRDALFLLLATTACWSLVRYPFAGAIYYFYVAPLVLLSIAAVAARLRPQPRHALAGIAAFYTLFALLWIGPNSLTGIAQRTYVPAADDYMPPVPRLGLRMTEGEAAQFEQLVTAVQERARGRFIFATPDAPEVYFLTGMQNPTRTLFDFFDEPAGRTERVLAQLRAADVNVVVTKQFIPFSGPIAPDLLAAIERQYPYAQRFGMYIVRWRP